MENKKSLFDLILEEENLLDRTKELEITRLSKKFGTTFKVNITMLSDRQIEECYSNDTTFKIDFILESLQLEGKSLKDKSLLSKFGAKTYRDVVKAIFNSGEISYLYMEILKLNGLSGDTIVELKN